MLREQTQTLLKPYKKTYQTCTHRELTGWRECNSSETNLNSRIKISKPFYVNSLKEFNTNPRYPDYKFENCLPLISPVYKKTNYLKKSKFEEKTQINEKKSAGKIRNSFSTRASNSIKGMHSKTNSLELQNISKLERNLSITNEIFQKNEENHFILERFKLKSEQKYQFSDEKNDFNEIIKTEINEEKDNILRHLNDNNYHTNNEESEKKNNGLSNPVKVCTKSSEFKNKNENFKEFQDKNSKKFEKFESLTDERRLPQVKNEQILNYNKNSRRNSEQTIQDTQIKQQPTLNSSQKIKKSSKSIGNLVINKNSEEKILHPTRKSPKKNKITKNTKKKVYKIIIDKKNSPYSSNNEKPQLANKSKLETPIKQLFEIDFESKNPELKSNFEKNFDFSDKLEEKNQENAHIKNLSPIEEEKNEKSFTKNDSKRNFQRKKFKKLQKPKIAIELSIPEKNFSDIQSEISLESERKSFLKPELMNQASIKTKSLENVLSFEKDPQILKKYSKDFETIDKSPRQNREKFKEPENRDFSQVSMNVLKKTTVPQISNPRKTSLNSSDIIENSSKPVPKLRIEIIPPESHEKIRSQKRSLIRTNTMSSLELKKNSNRINSSSLNKPKIKRTKTFRSDSSKSLNTSKESKSIFEGLPSVDRFINNYSMSFLNQLQLLMFDLTQKVENISSDAVKVDLEKLNMLALKENDRKNIAIRKKNMKKRMKVELNAVFNPINSEKNNMKLGKNKKKIVEKIKKGIFSDGVKKELLDYLRVNKKVKRSSSLFRGMSEIIKKRFNKGKIIKNIMNSSQDSLSSDESFRFFMENRQENEQIHEKNSAKNAKIRNLQQLRYEMGQQTKLSTLQSDRNEENTKSLIKIVSNLPTSENIESLSDESQNLNFSLNEIDVGKEIELINFEKIEDKKRFLFSSQVNFNQIDSEMIKIYKEINNIEAEDEIDVKNLEYFMLKKKFYKLKKLQMKRIKNTYNGLVIHNTDQLDPEEQLYYKIKAVRKYLKKLKNKNVYNKFAIMPKTQITFSGLVKKMS